MEIKQGSLKHQWVKEEIKGEIKDFLNSMKMVTQNTQIYGIQ